MIIGAASLKWGILIQILSSTKNSTIKVRFQQNILKILKKA
jgi:hypothetical protein